MCTGTYLHAAAVHVTFLWPVIITEMVQVFSYIENQLLADTEEFRYRYLYPYGTTYRPSYLTHIISSCNTDLLLRLQDNFLNNLLLWNIASNCSEP